MYTEGTQGTGKFDYRRDLHLCGQMYMRSRVPKYIDQRELPTRQFDRIVLKIPDVILTKTFKSPIYNGSQMWMPSPNMFKTVKHIQISNTSINNTLLDAYKSFDLVVL